MKIIDLSHKVSSTMPVYPGTECPEISTPCTIENNGFVEKKITMYSHTGTHVDAPAHLTKDAATLDQIPLNHYIGKTSVLNLSQINNPTIETKDLASFQDFFEKSEFILLFTGWSKLWNKAAYFENYPVLTIEAAKWVTRFNLKGIGIDMISMDRLDSHSFPIHKIFLKKNIIIIENLTNLEHIPDTSFIFSCFPLKIAHADGSPVRAVALIED